MFLFAFLLKIYVFFFIIVALSAVEMYERSFLTSRASRGNAMKLEAIIFLYPKLLLL